MHIVIAADVLAKTTLILSSGALLLSVGIGLILGYHWYRFGLSPLAATGTLALYIAGTILLVSMLYTSGSQIIL
jgi:hypothetical protein